MLKKAVQFYKRQCKTVGAYQDRFIIVDRDRSDQGDWPVEKLRREATKHKITVCLQNPNHEGLLFRMLPGMERERLEAAETERKLKVQWPGYQKPMNAEALGRKFSIDDLLRVSKVDGDLASLLGKIGLRGS